MDWIWLLIPLHLLLWRLGYMAFVATWTQDFDLTRSDQQLFTVLSFVWITSPLLWLMMRPQSQRSRKVVVNRKNP